jgi:hypothetical protein
MEKEIDLSNSITLKLEDEETKIYLNGREFKKCKYLLLNIPIDKVQEFEEIESIDEAKAIYDSSMEHKKASEYNITPEEEFVAHTSNLQAWIENDYNPNLLHSNLSIPLLRTLIKSGDKKALIVLKEYLLQKFEENREVSEERTFFFLLDYLSEEELDLFLKIKPDLRETLISKVKGDYETGKKFGDQIARRFNTTIISDYGRIRYYGGDPYDNRMKMYRGIHGILDSILDSSYTSIRYEGIKYGVSKRVGNYTMKVPIHLDNGKYYFRGFIYPSGKYRDFKIIGFDGEIGEVGNKNKVYCKISHNDYIIEEDNEIRKTDYGFTSSLTELIKDDLFNDFFMLR